MQIKKINENNIDELHSLSQTELGKDSWSLNQFQDCLNNKNYITYLLYSNKTLISFLVAHNLVDSINVLLIATHKNFKNRGFASKLLNLLIKENKNLKIWLEVKENNLPAINLYKKLGFKQVHKRENYYKDGYSAIIFEKNQP